MRSQGSPPGRLHLAPADTRTAWRRRRLLYGVPAAVLFVVQMAGVAAQPSSAWMWVAIPAGIAVVLSTIFATVAVRSRAMARSRGSALWKSFGRFRLDDLQAARITPPAGSHTGTRLPAVSKGWLDGTAVLWPESLTFFSGRLASRAGLGEFCLRWNDVSNVEVNPMRLSFNIGLRITLHNGRSVDCELRGGRRLLAALQDTGLTAEK